MYLRTSNGRRLEKSFNGSRLELARIYNGYTIKDLSEKVGHPRQTLSAYENGKEANPSPFIIQKISEVLGFPITFFYEKTTPVKVGSTYFRALRTTSKKYRDQQRQKMSILSSIYTFISEYIRFPVFDPLALKNISSDDPEHAADSLRQHWQLGIKPIENIIFTVEENGIPITSYETSTDAIDAFSQMIDIENRNIYLIGYSSNKTSAARIHFDIAHELGHIIMHEWSEDVEALTKDEFKERENEAHAFASAFLMPKDSFLYDIKNCHLNIPMYIQLKKKWKVSIAAMARRAYTLGVTTYDDYQNMMRLLQRRGIRKDEPLDDVLVTSKPTLLKMAIQMLLDERIFTPKEFINELAYNNNMSLNSQIIEELLGLPQNTLVDVAPTHKLSVKNKPSLGIANLKI
ncbi:MAG: XRE family transcriptional regulator [Defluviitaleaceae bacterium]|nr:XRE family transcriptional regulator [Defluviitaleaceae bacterium]MCL2274624.1 XRE family transcriptional regulator [Defluviitaleaceae bacterium]